MRDLVRHLSEIHLWAAGVISQRAAKLFPDDISEHSETWPDLAVFWPDDGDLVDWYLETPTSSAASRTLHRPMRSPTSSRHRHHSRCGRDARPTRSPLHRWDAENASGTASGFDPVFTADGIDETVDAYATLADEFPTTSTCTMAVHAVDTGDRWNLTVTPNGITTVRGDGPADVTLSGAASDLHLALWNGTEDSTITVNGAHDLLHVWHDNVRLRWPFTTHYS